MTAAERLASLPPDELAVLESEAVIRLHARGRREGSAVWDYALAMELEALLVERGLVRAQPRTLDAKRSQWRSWMDETAKERDR